MQQGNSVNYIIPNKFLIMTAVISLKMFVFMYDKQSVNSFLNILIYLNIVERIFYYLKYKFKNTGSTFSSIVSFIITMISLFTVNQNLNLNLKNFEVDEDDKSEKRQITKNRGRKLLSNIYHQINPINQAPSQLNEDDIGKSTSAPEFDINGLNSSMSTCLASDRVRVEHSQRKSSEKNQSKIFDLENQCLTVENFRCFMYKSKIVKLIRFIKNCTYYDIVNVPNH